MHETGVAEEILTLALRTADSHSAKRITRLGITLGNLSGVDGSSLGFALEALKEDTIAAGCEIEITEVKAAGICAECGRESVPDTFFATCSHCGLPFLEITGGDNISLDYVDLE